MLREYFSGEEGLKRSNAFLKFANMLVSNEHMKKHGPHRGWNGCFADVVPNDNCTPVDYWQFLMSGAESMETDQ